MSSPFLMLQQFEAAHSRQVPSTRRHAFAADTIGFEERFARRELLDEPSVSLRAHYELPRGHDCHHR